MGQIPINITDDNILSKADTDLIIQEVNDNDTRVTQNANAIAAIDPSASIDILSLPSIIETNIGETTQLFFDSMINGLKGDYNFAVTNTSRPAAVTAAVDLGFTYERYFEITPIIGGEGDYTFSVYLYNSANVLLQTKSFTLRVGSANQNPSSLIQAVAVGDSVTAMGWSTEMERRVTSSSGTPLGNGFTNFDIINEGASGKTWAWFLGSSSPFYFGGKLDFNAYITDKGIASLDHLYILLTYNGLTSRQESDAYWTSWASSATTFIDAYMADIPNGKVSLMSITPPSTKASLATNGTSSQIYYGYFQYKNSYWRVLQEYDKIANDPIYSANVDHIATGIQFDADNSYDEIDKAVNTRSSLTEKIGSGGVHPSTDVGIMQIADSAYRHFINNYCQ